MTERERLIELIRKAKHQEYIDALTADIDTAIDMPRCEEYLADYLLANGVICPPCKVGDRVYTIHRLSCFPCEATVKAIYFTEDKKYYPKPHIIVQYDMHRGRLRYNFSDFGKNVFLTREEAEKTLAQH